MTRFALPAVVLAATLSSSAAFASSSQWFETEGGSVRLVTTGKPDADGHLNGILDIVLKPGWKTYWQDPGDAGVPPQVDIAASTNVASADLAFPAPQRHDDGYNKWAGYDYPVAFPITFTLPSPAAPAKIEASIFLGICETICIPVQTTLSVDPAADADNLDDAAAVTTAFATLPEPAGDDFGVKPVSVQGGTMMVQATVPGNPASAELFVAASDGYSFAQPERVEKDGDVFFSVQILDRPAAIPVQGGLHYTLVSPAGAVSGLLPYP